MEHAQTPRVLIVEDNRADARLVQRRLGHDFSATIAPSLKDALDTLAEEPVDVLLVDLGLPDSVGVDGIRQLRRAVGDTPIVVVTGSDRDTQNAEAVRAGAQDVLVKDDITSGGLRRTIRSALERKGLDRMRHRLERASRLAAVGQLAAGVAHEVNNPATFLLVNTELCIDTVSSLREAATLDDLRGELPQLETMLRENLEGVRRIQEVVRRLGSFAHLHEDVVEWVDVNDAVSAAAALSRSEVRHRAAMSLTLGEIPKIAGHRGQICQVVLNLLINAAHAIGEGDSTAQRIHVVTLDDEATSSVLVRVEDTGCGMTDEVLRQLFDPFFTTKAPGQGTGLGLALSQEIAQRHGGELTAASVVGEGSTFTLRIPHQTPFAPPPSRFQPKAAGRKQITRHHVMVIDDEPSVRRAMERLLRRHFAVESFGDAVDALERLASGAHFDAILCDLMMPGLDGAAVYERLKTEHPDMVKRILFVSGGALSDKVRALVDRENVMVLAKPAESTALVAAIDEIASRQPPG